MKENSSLISIENNKKSNINVNIGVMDELSCDSIRRNYNNVVDLENEFTDRIEYSKEILTKKLLPKQLQSDFSIEPKLKNGKMEYETKPITTDAYEKFPLTLNYTMKFNSIEEANQFRKGGIEELQRKADLIQKPVEIPNITNMREFIGEFENPVAHSTKYGSNGIKLYICPRPIPPAQKYKIEIFNEKMTFKISSMLRITSVGEDAVILSNEDSLNEPFNIKIKLSELRKTLEDKNIQGKFNITISLKEQYYNDCELNKEILKFSFIMDDKTNCILIDNEELNENLFYFEHCGEKRYSEKVYKRMENTLKLIDKVIYISKMKKIKINYDIEYFFQKEELINLVYNEINSKNYKSNKMMDCSIMLNNDTDISNIMKHNGKIVYKSFLDSISLFGVDIKLKKYNIIMYNCRIEEMANDENVKKIIVHSNNVVFSLIEESKKD